MLIIIIINFKSETIKYPASGAQIRFISPHGVPQILPTVIHYLIDFWSLWILNLLENWLTEWRYFGSINILVNSGNNARRELLHMVLTLFTRISWTKQTKRYMYTCIIKWLLSGKFIKFWVRQSNIHCQPTFVLVVSNEEWASIELITVLVLIIQCTIHFCKRYISAASYYPCI
jgi:hypothetical protein